MMFNEPSFCLFVLKSPWPCPRAAGQKWLMAHATHTPHGSRLTRLVFFLPLLLWLLLLTATNDVVVVFVVVDVGCWLSIRMLVVGFVACSDLCGLLVVVVAMVVSWSWSNSSQERCRKCVLSCFVITSSRFPQILFSSFITLFRFSFALFSNKKKVEKINLEITIALRIFSFFKALSR